MINDQRAASLLVYRKALRLWHEAGMLWCLFEGDKRARRALDQPGDRVTQKLLGGAAGQQGDAGKLRREIGGNLHARDNLSSTRGRAHTTLWSGGSQICIIRPVLGRPIPSFVSLWYFPKLFRMRVLNAAIPNWPIEDTLVT